MPAPKTIHHIGLSLAAAFTILMLLGIDSLAQPDDETVSVTAQTEPRSMAGPGT